MVYLISHTNSGSNTGVACAKIEAETEASALEEFAKQYPEREVSRVGIKGVGE